MPHCLQLWCRGCNPDLHPHLMMMMLMLMMMNFTFSGDSWDYSSQSNILSTLRHILCHISGHWGHSTPGCTSKGSISYVLVEWRSALNILCYQNLVFLEFSSGIHFDPSKCPRNVSILANSAPRLPVLVKNTVHKCCLTFQSHAGKILIFEPCDPTSHIGFWVRHFERECDFFLLPKKSFLPQIYFFAPIYFWLTFSCRCQK
jgi:hypothetical protein